MKKRSINGNHINMIKGRLGGEGIDSDAALWPAMSTSNMLMNRAAKTEVGWVDRGHMKGEELTLKQQEVVWEQVGGTLVSCSSGCHISRCLNITSGLFSEDDVSAGGYDRWLICRDLFTLVSREWI